MADSPAQLTFRSWLRRGMATQMALRNPSDQRASIKIDVAIANVSPAPSVALSLYGPGDITNFDQSAIVRAWPKPGARNTEANYFPLIEFDQPDLPWRFSPQANTTDQVKPWLCLVVIETGKAVEIRSTTTQPLAVLNVDSALLPDLEESALWAHAQLHGPDITDNNALASRLDNDPGYFASRILSVSILQPETEYTAYLVPTFELGRRAGLGLDPDGAGGLDPAWKPGAGTVSLPVFYQWSFATGPVGDFASLVRKITPKPLAPEVGTRKMDVSTPGLGLPAAFDAAMPVTGALQRLPIDDSFKWTGPTRENFVSQLVNLLNKPAQLFGSDPLHPLVVPPLYGHWHAAQTEIDSSSPPWFTTLNEDPRARVQAGAATIAVQQEQQDLLAGAWDQVGEVKAANERARWMELAIEIGNRLFQKSIVSIAAKNIDSFFQFTGPVLNRVKGSPRSIGQYLRESPVVTAVLSPAYRRITRPRGPIAKRQNRTEGLPSLIDRMNQGSFSPAPPMPVASGMNSTGNMGSSLVPSWLTPFVLRLLRLLPAILLLLAILGVAGALLLFSLGAAAFAAALVVAGLAFFLTSFAIRPIIQNLEARVALRDGHLTGALLRSLPIRGSFMASTYPAGNQPPVPIASGAAAPAVAANFVTGAAKLLDNLAIAPFTPPPLVQVSFDAFRTSLTAQLDARTVLAGAFKSQLLLSSAAYQLAGSDTGQIMAGPQFNKAFYESIRAVSQDWILPGVDKSQPNTACLVANNQAAVEAFMVGANHEMSRTLLYNEYPTDLRFTYFRQFWDITGAPGSDTRPDDFLDIKPIHTWGNANLGDNTARKEPPGENDVVLFVRGEVLLRYPNTLVYAVRAARNPGDPNLPPLVLADESNPANVRFWNLHGSLDPDIRFFGFPLTIIEATAGDGWFFVLQQHPGEPVFGFDVVSLSPLKTFKEVTWNMVLGAAAPVAVPPAGVQAATPPAATPRYLSFQKASSAVQALISALGPRTPRWGSSSAEVASHTLRRPVRVAYHARKMVPPI